MRQEMYEHIHGLERTHWWYVARRQIVEEWIARLLNADDSLRILDVGCGTGLNVERLRAAGYDNVVGLDVSSDALAFCQERRLPELLCGDAAELPLKSASLDLIVALDVIEHLVDDERALDGLARALRPGGSLLIFAPAFMFLWGLQDEVSHHWRRYTARELRAKLEAAGLRVDRLTYANTFLFPLILFGRLVLRAFGNNVSVTSENDLHPPWTGVVLRTVFASERWFLRHISFPFGVSVLATASKVGVSTVTPPAAGREQEAVP